MDFFNVEHFNYLLRTTQWSSLVCYAESIRDKNLSEKVIRRNFNKYVDKEDYGQKREVKDEVLTWLFSISGGEKASETLSLPVCEKMERSPSFAGGCVR